MKRLFLISLCLLAAACTKTPEQKAEILIKDTMLKTLVLPESYQAVETQLDSAFTPYHDPEYIATVLDLYKIVANLDGIDRQMKMAKSTMSLWAGNYRTSYAREQYNQAKEEYDEASSKHEALVSKIKKMAESLQEKAEKEPEFIGYRAHHRFRAQLNNGDTILSGEYFLLDKELTRIVAKWSEEEISIYESFFSSLADAAELE